MARERKHTHAAKVCKGCERRLPITEYYRHPETADRLTTKCKACLCEYQRLYRLLKKYGRKKWTRTTKNSGR